MRKHGETFWKGLIMLRFSAQVMSPEAFDELYLFEFFSKLSSLCNFLLRKQEWKDWFRQKPEIFFEKIQQKKTQQNS